jgi:hypothetical protein
VSRARARTALVDVLTNVPELINIGVDRSWPGDELQREHLWIAKVEGTVTFPTMMAGRLQRDDIFTFTVLCQSSTEGQDPEACETACEVYMTAVALAAADQSLFGQIRSQVPGLLAVDLGEFNGPDAQPTTEGWVAFGEVQLEFHIRSA